MGLWKSRLLKLQIFFTFSPVDHLRLFLILFLLIIADWQVRLFSSKKLIAFLTAKHKSKKPLTIPASNKNFNRWVELLEKLDRHLGSSPSCLRRAVALRWLLWIFAREAEGRIGVRFASKTLEAHAWLEQAGIPMENKQSQDYLALMKSSTK